MPGDEPFAVVIRIRSSVVADATPLQNTPTMRPLVGVVNWICVMFDAERDPFVARS
jgi:hypothetical protein